MTPEQQARLGELAVWVGTAQELLELARYAVYGVNVDDAPTLHDVMPAHIRVAIAAAASETITAAGLLLPLVQAKGATNE